MSDRLLVENVSRGKDTGLDGRMTPAFLWLGVIGASVFVGVVHVNLNAHVGLTLVYVSGLSIVVLSLLRPIISFYILLALAMAIEQYPAEDGWTLNIEYHTNLSIITPSLSGLSVNLLEIHILLLVAGVLLQFVILKQKGQQVIARFPLLLYAASLIIFLAYGLSQGGTLFPALWEIRGIFYLVTLALLVPTIVRTERHLKTVVWIIIGTLAFRAAEVITLYVNAGWSLGTGEGWGNHEDAGFLAVMFMFLVAMQLFHAYPAQRRALAILLVPFLVAFVASGRRTVYGVFGSSLVVLFLMLEKDLQRRFLKVAWKAVLAFLVYLVIFWNSESEIASPARSIRMAFAEDEQAAGIRYGSNLYRKAENYNLIRMVQKSPLLGTGYGVFLDYSAMPMPIFWEFGLFVPHNQLLGIAAKTGMLGFIIFWFFYLSLLAKVAQSFNDAVSAYHKAVLVLVSAAIMNHLVYSYFDIMLTYYRNNVFLGSLLGLASVVIAWNRNTGGIPFASSPGMRGRRPEKNRTGRAPGDVTNEEAR